jgi:hypothetical protein
MSCDRLMDRAYGKAPAVAQVDQNRREVAVHKLEVRSPPDPNDTSRYTRGGFVAPSLCSLA